MPHYTRRVFAGTSVVLIAMVIGAGLGYVFRLVLSRYLSLEDFGLFFAVLSFLNLFYGLKQLGTGPAFVRYVSEYRSKNQPRNVKKVLLSFIIIQLLLFGVLSIIILLSAGFLSEHYFKTSRAMAVIIILTVAFLFSVLMSAFRGFFNGYQRMGYYSFVELGQTVFVLIASVILLWLGFGVMAPTMAYLISFMIVAIICFVLVLRIFPLFKVRTRLDRRTFKKLIIFGIPVTGAIVLSSVMSSIDTTVLTYFRPLSEVALYSVALPTAGLLNYLPRALSAVLLPLSTELHLTKNVDFSSGLTRLYRYVGVIMSLPVLLMISFPQEIVTILFGPKFAGAAVALQILAPGLMCAAIFMVNQTILLGIGKPKQYTWVVLVGTIVMTVACFALIPFFGMAGAASADMVGNITVLVMSSLILRKYLQHTIPWKAWVKTICASGVAIVIIGVLKAALPLALWPKLVLISLCGCLVYVASLYVMKVIRAQDIRLGVSTIMRIAGRESS